MRVGVPREIKTEEYRVGMIPPTAAELVAHGHQVLVESGAGAGAGIDDAAYAAVGAEIVTGPGPVFARAELIVKVKEPLAVERRRLRRGQIIFTYLHLAPDPDQTAELVESGASAIAYETVSDPAGRLPLLAPMSEVAGSMAPQVAAHFLERPCGGCGILLSGVEGVPAANVVVLGGGMVGLSAARIAIGMGAEVTVVARSAASLQRATERFGMAVRTAHSTPEAIHELCVAADAVIAGALVPGAMAPKLITARTIKAMKPGSVLVDVSIDQGGCAETSRPTTHAQPTYVVDGVVHYCVANMPGAVPRTSTFALNRATRPFIVALADKGLHAAVRDDAHLRAGLNVHDGKVTCRAVAEALALSYVPVANALGD